MVACPERQSYITANVTVRTVILQTLSLKELSSACQNVQTSAVNLEKKIGVMPPNTRGYCLAYHALYNISRGETMIYLPRPHPN